jgi:hypothetical protein
MSGVPLMTGLSAGTQTKCLGLDSGNHIVYVASACGSGGGSAWDITDGTHTVTSVTGLTVGNGFLIGGSAGAATLNGTNTLNTQSGTGAYAILAGDAGLQVVRTNASGGADTIAAASTTNFTSGYSTMYTANGQAGNTITPASGTIGGLSVLKVGKNQSVSLDSDGTNYNVAASVPIPATQTDTLWLSDDFVWRTKPLASASVFGLAKVDGTTITASGGVLTATAGGSGCTVSGAAGAVFNTGSSTCTTDTSILATAGALSLGASGTAGSVAMGNATTGTITLQPVTGALGSVTASLPANTGTIAELNLAQTWTAAQTNSAAAPQLILGVNTSTLGAIKMFGNTSGDVTIEPNAVAGTSTIMKVPAWGATGNVAAIDVAQTFTASQTFGQVQGKNTAQSGTTYSFAATDCGTEVIFTSGSAVTATIPASIVPAAGTGCVIAINQSGAGKVSVNGSAVTPATLVSAHSYTATSGTAGSEIALRLTTIGATATATLTGDGS